MKPRRVNIADLNFCWSLVGVANLRKELLVPGAFHSNLQLQLWKWKLLAAQSKDLDTPSVACFSAWFTFSFKKNYIMLLFQAEYWKSLHLFLKALISPTFWSLVCNQREKVEKLNSGKPSKSILAHAFSLVVGHTSEHFSSEVCNPQGEGHRQFTTTVCCVTLWHRHNPKGFLLTYCPTPTSQTTHLPWSNRTLAIEQPTDVTKCLLDKSAVYWFSFNADYDLGNEFA